MDSMYYTLQRININQSRLKQVTYIFLNFKSWMTSKTFWKDRRGLVWLWKRKKQRKWRVVLKCGEDRMQGLTCLEKFSDWSKTRFHFLVTEEEKIGVKISHQPTQQSFSTINCIVSESYILGDFKAAVYENVEGARDFFISRHPGSIVLFF